MAKFETNYPIDGSSALELEGGGSTRIIAFPAHARRPKHAKPSDASVDPFDDHTRIRDVPSAVLECDMVRQLREGTCSGKAVGGMTPVQSALACLGFFALGMATLFLL